MSLLLPRKFKGRTFLIPMLTARSISDRSAGSMSHFVQGCPLVSRMKTTSSLSGFRRWCRFVNPRPLWMCLLNVWGAPAENPSSKWFSPYRQRSQLVVQSPEEKMNFPTVCISKDSLHCSINVSRSSEALSSASKASRRATATLNAKCTWSRKDCARSGGQPSPCNSSWNVFSRSVMAGSRV